jgi:hypothetical protein
LLEPLELKEGQVLEATVIESPQADEKHERIFDMHMGNYWMSDDFDDELPDSFWFGEENKWLPYALFTLSMKMAHCDF